MSYNLVDPTTGDLTRVASSIDTSIIPSNASASNKLATTSDMTSLLKNKMSCYTWGIDKTLKAVFYEITDRGILADVNDAVGKRIIARYGNVLINRITQINGIKNLYWDDTLVLSCPWNDDTTKLTDVLEIFVGTTAWQQLVTTDDIFRAGDRRNTIGWADLSHDVNIDGSSNYANNIGRIEGHNALIEVSNPSIGYQWPVTNSGDNNIFMDFGGAIQFFTDKVNNHLYVRFANSVDISAWGEIATMDNVARDVDTSYMSNGVLNILAIRQSLGAGCYEIMGQGNSGHGSIRLNIWQVSSGAFAFSCCITDFSGVRSICSNDGNSTTVDVGTSYFAKTNRIVKIF